MSKRAIVNSVNSRCKSNNVPKLNPSSDCSTSLSTELNAMGNDCIFCDTHDHVNSVLVDLRLSKIVES